MQKKQTAVQWLISKIEEKNGKEHISYCYEFFDQALALEREQHENIWDAAIEAHENRGHNKSRSICDFDEYYPETYL